MMFRLGRMRLRRNHAHTKLACMVGAFAVLAACGVSYGVYHTVRPGQTLYRISRTYGVEEEKIMRINRLKDAAQIRAGQKIFIPGVMKELEVEPVLGGLGANEGQGVSPASFSVRRGDDIHPSGSPDHAPSFIWPVKGRILSEYGTRGTRIHDGVDISAPEGEPIHAAASGRVIYSDNGLRGYGNIIVIRHQGRLSTIYAHNRVNLVKEGDFVEQGQVIGKVGESGRATAPHLHFEVRNGETPVNPLVYLK